MMYKTSHTRLFVSAAALGCLFATTANAVSVTFDFTGDGTTNITNPQDLDFRGTPLTFGLDWSQTISTSDGDVTLTVVPHGFTAGAAGTAASSSFAGQNYDGRILADNARDPQSNITQTALGLGVMNNGTAATDDAPFDVDGSSGGAFGNGWFDYLVLQFDREVSLDFANLSNFDASDQFHFVFDANGDGILGNAGDFLTDGLAAGLGAGGVANFLPGPDFLFTDLGIAAIDGDSAFRLEELGVSLAPAAGGTPGTGTPGSGTPGTGNPTTGTPTPGNPTTGTPVIGSPNPGGPPSNPSGPSTPDAPTIAPVPLPAAGWLLLAGFAGLGFLRGTRRA